MVLNHPTSAPRPARASIGPIPREIANIVVVTVGLLMALEIGSSIADAVNATTPWLCMACYAGPLAAVSALFWLIGRRF
jgi:hypothetical protein